LHFTTNAHFNNILILISTIFVSVLSRTFFMEKVSRLKNLNVALIFRKILTIEKSLFRAALRSAAFILNNFRYNLVILTRCAVWNKMIGRLIFCYISEYIRKKIYYYVYIPLYVSIPKIAFLERVPQKLWEQM
jgi:hypothetical protein